MSALVASELLKLRTVRAIWGYLVAVALLSALTAAAVVGGSVRADRAEEAFAADVASAAAVAGVIALVLGIVIVTVEFRHGTVTPTFLVAPIRERVLAAKWITGALGGAALGLIGLAVAGATAVIWLATLGESASVGGDAAEQAGRVLLYAVLVALLGVSVGALLHAQVFALIAGLIWFLGGELAVAGVLGVLGADDAGRYLPSAALDAVLGGEGTLTETLSFAAGLATSVAWIVGFGAAAALRTRGTDVT